jgi:protein TonB
LAGVEGVVRLRLSLDAEGRLLVAEVAESSGSPALDEAALAAARASRYAPAQLGAVAVPAETSATYRFELR